MRKPKTPQAIITVPPPPSESPPLLKVKGKLGAMVTLLRRDEGATVAQLIELTGWQEHSVRGALAGALKKRGLTISSTKEADIRIYRILEPGPADAVAPGPASPAPL